MDKTGRITGKDREKEPDIRELFDLGELQRLQDAFAHAHGVASIITTPGGMPVTQPSNFCRLCTLIRTTDRGQANCFKSDRVIGAHHPDGPIVQPCLSSGLWDAGASITVSGKHIANWLIGQVRNAEMDEQKVADYADQIGLDRESFVQAFREVPVMAAGQFQQVASMLYEFANFLSDKAYQNLLLKDEIQRRTEAENKLRESEKRWRKAVADSPVPIMIHDEDDNVIALSNGWTKFSGYTLADIPTVTDWTEKAYGERTGSKKEYIDALFSIDQTKENGEWIVRTKDGAKRIWEFRTTPLGTLPNGRRVLHSMAIDITDQRENEIKLLEKNEEIEAQNEEYQVINEELTETNRMLHEAKLKAEQSDRLKTAFLQNMSHEIRTPMNAIMGFASLMGDNFDNKEKIERFSKIIMQRCGDLLDIINDLLDISKIESGQVEAHHTEFLLSDLVAVMASFFDDYQVRLGKQHIALVWDLSPTLLQKPIVTDKGKLKQIFINLIGNAYKFTSEGQITVGCQRGADSRLTFSVADTGIGIPREHQDTIFDRFVQLNSEMPLVSKGTGLGLPIVKGLVKLLEGDIRVHSTPGEGTIFYFTIPVN